MENEEGGTPQGVQDRINKITAQRREAVARAEAAEAKLSEYAPRLEAATALETANAELAAALDASKSSFAQLEGLVSAGFTDAEDRDLATFYHQRAGVETPLTEWAAGLSADTAPKGLAHLYTGGGITAPPKQEATPEGKPAPKLPDSNNGVAPPQPPQGEVTAEMLASMTDAQFAEYRKRYASVRPKRR